MNPDALRRRAWEKHLRSRFSVSGALAKRTVAELVRLEREAQAAAEPQERPFIERLRGALRNG